MAGPLKVLITGSCGLIGSEAVRFYCGAGHTVRGIDNNLRRYFFGAGGDTSSVQTRLTQELANYEHISFDIRDRKEVDHVFSQFQPDLVIHTAAQPSHDWAAKEPFTDFEVNAVATLNLLESFRKHTPKGVFLFMSTNKVYGDAPNFVELTETKLRYEYGPELMGKGIPETMSVDQCLHSLFGASKLSADILCQEYGRYFGLNVGVFRGGCLTGPQHASVELHGFLSYIVKCAVTGKPYTIFGYKGKQVRDQIHSRDVIRAFECFRKAPRKGEVYNLGGGYRNSASVLEIIGMLKDKFQLTLNHSYQEQARKGDHICYYSDLTKLKQHYPSFELTMSLEDILSEMIHEMRSVTAKAA